MFKHIVLMMLFAMSLASAATIHGIVYDLSLEPVDKSVIEVNSVPQQRIIAIDGEYSFNLPKGSYSITARSDNDIAVENITIAEDGIYNLDLFLFPVLDEDIADDVDIDIVDEKADYKPYIFVSALIVVIALSILLYKFRRKSTSKKEHVVQEKQIDYMDDDKEKILGIIKKHSNRTTQKDIRKEVSLSEAKVSLIIAELEHEGKIKKIKKGRGNIVILNEQGHPSN